MAAPSNKLMGNILYTLMRRMRSKSVRELQMIKKFPMNKDNKRRHITASVWEQAAQLIEETMVYYE